MISVTRNGNRFIVDGNAEAIYINESFVDFEREVTVIHNGKKLIFEPKFSEKTLRESFVSRFDKNFAFTCKLDLLKEREE